MTESDRPSTIPSRAADIDRQELLDLYKVVIDEYRFQVKLNSDRTQIYLVLNAAILAAGTGLLKVGGPDLHPLVALIFVVGAFVAHIAARGVRQGHEYYRAIIYKKTLIEDLLGRRQPIAGYDFRGATLAVETTVGMSDEIEILKGTERWLVRPVRPNTITGGLILIFRIFVWMDVFAVLFLIGAAMWQLLAM